MIKNQKNYLNEKWTFLCLKFSLCSPLQLIVKYFYKLLSHLRKTQKNLSNFREINKKGESKNIVNFYCLREIFHFSSLRFSLLPQAIHGNNVYIE